MPRPASTESQASQPGPVQRRKYLAGPGALLGGPANVVMQPSPAPVGRGVVESTLDSGRFDLHPRKRGRTTLTYLAVAMLGTDEERAAYRAATDTSHRHVRSRPGSPVKYKRLRPRTPTVGRRLHLPRRRGFADLSLRPTPRGGRRRVVPESARFGTTLQMRPEMWPADRTAFARYWEAKSAEISLDAEVKAYLLEQVVGLGPYSRLEQLAFRRVNRFFTTGFLPHRFREELGLDWGPGRQRAFRLVMRAIGALTAAGPERWRLYPLNRHLADMRRRRALGKPLV